jgi:NADP-dependent 3-hydroxyisobutyrate dehydrogenase-like protein
VRKSGIDPQRYLDILTGSLFSAPIYRTYGSIIAEDRIPADGFKMSLALKDIRLALAAADAKTVPMPVASLIRDHLRGRRPGRGKYRLVRAGATVRAKCGAVEAGRRVASARAAAIVGLPGPCGVELP